MEPTQSREAHVQKRVTRSDGSTRQRRCLSFFESFQVCMTTIFTLPQRQFDKNSKCTHGPMPP
nr:hypothetical protein [Terrilactibacillus tamarindi]